MRGGTLIGMNPMPEQRPLAPSRAAWVVLLTAAAYTIVGWLALQLAVDSGYASPIYPAAGIGLAATLAFGRFGAVGTGIGALAVNLIHTASIGATDPVSALVVPLISGLGALAQAALGAVLVHRFVAQPLTLREPRDILRFSLLGGMLACLVNSSLSTAALGITGAVAVPSLAFTWWTWWVGDVLGVLIGAPIALTLVGQPRSEWIARRLSVGAPMLVGTLMLAGASALFQHWDRQRMRETFEHGAADVASDMADRLNVALGALQAVHGTLASTPDPGRAALHQAADWWLTHSAGIQAIGLSERVTRSEVPALEARAHSEGLANYRVFDRADATPDAGADVVAIRAIEPLDSNAAALGVNAMSIPAAREAMVAAARTGEAVSTRGFQLTQAGRAGETGAVVYRALYRGEPTTENERMAQWRGVAFVTLQLDRLLQSSSGHAGQALGWCLVESADGGVRRLAGPAGCEIRSRTDFHLQSALSFAGQPWELWVSGNSRDLPGGTQSGAWLFSLVGLVATSLLGMLLLTVTGRARRIELAVEERTRALSGEIQERRSAEEALRDSEQRLRDILDHVPIGVLFIDTHGVVLDTNPSLCRMVGRTAEHLRNTTVIELIHPEDREPNRTALRDLLAARMPLARRQLRLLRADGGAVTVRAALSPLRDTSGRVDRLVVVVEDITEHLRLAETERARDEAQASNRAKSDFVSRMSHELRTPLNAMLGFAQLLGMDRRPALAPHQLGWATQIQHAGWHLLDMINDTLDLSRLEAGLVQLNARALELGPMVDATMALLSAAASKRNVQVAVALAPEAQAVMADETRLKQVLTNLLSNAVKYNRDGGEIRISSRLADSQTVEISVRDTGMGMSSLQLASLFQPYNRLGRETTSIEGTGIGLVISRRLAEAMGGSLDATSSEHEGSLFTLCLPRASFSDTGTLVASAGEEAVPLYQRRIVHYIEDNETNIEVMRGILAQRPQVTLEVSMTGLDGLAAVRQRRPDLILLDMHLPDIGGLELLRHLKRDDVIADIPVLVVSADATPARIEQALTLGAAHYLTKPVDLGSFLRTLDEALAELDTRWG